MSGYENRPQQDRHWMRVQLSTARKKFARGRDKSPDRLLLLDYMEKLVEDAFAEADKHQRNWHYEEFAGSLANLVAITIEFWMLSPSGRNTQIEDAIKRIKRYIHPA